MARVFVVQNQHYKNAKGELVPKYDLGDARRFGELIDLLGPSARPHEPNHVIRELHEKLWDFSDSDYLLLVGNPVLIGFATAIAAFYNDERVKLLQWGGNQYFAIEANLFGQPRAA